MALIHSKLSKKCQNYMNLTFLELLQTMLKIFAQQTMTKAFYFGVGPYALEQLIDSYKLFLSIFCLFVLDHYEKVPRMVKFLQRFTPFFRSGQDTPTIEATFEHKIRDLEMGCGYIIAQDEGNNTYSWGDNYAGQLGMGDDIHRDDPVLVKSLSSHQINQFSLGFQHCLFLNSHGHAYGMGKNNRF